MPKPKHSKSRPDKGAAQAAFSEKRGSEKMERAQIWSIDVLLAVVIFISIMIIFYVTITANDKPSIKDLQSEANFLSTELEKNPTYSFISNDVVDNKRLGTFVDAASSQYDLVKQELGVKGDFCIYFEDENGNLILLQDNRTGVGSGNINISDTPCGQAKW